MVRREEKKVFRLGDRIRALQAEAELVRQELSYHRLIDDDAKRDAAVTGSYIDRDEASLTGADVARFERALGELEAEIVATEEKRSRILDRMGNV